MSKSNERPINRKATGLQKESLYEGTELSSRMGYSTVYQLANIVEEMEFLDNLFNHPSKSMAGLE